MFDRLKRGKEPTLEEKPQIVAAIMIFSKDEKVLMMKKQKGTMYQDGWIMPTGNLEIGDSFEKCVFREAEKWTGIKAHQFVQ